MFILKLFVVLFAATACAQTIDLPSQIRQGELLMIKVPENATVKVDGIKTPVTQNGTFLAAAGRDRTNDLSLNIQVGQNVYEHTLPVMKRQWDTQRINGLKKKYVSPGKEILERIKGDNREIGRVRRMKTYTPYFESGFINPVPSARISGVFGSQRILNGKPRRPHNGLDLAAPTGTPILAPIAGKVVLIRDMHYTGHTVMLDHGFGLTSVYAHMHSVSVKLGDMLGQRDEIGTVGSTGRSTGPHLHWGVTLNKTHVDPALLIADQL